MATIIIALGLISGMIDFSIDNDNNLPIINFLSFYTKSKLLFITKAHHDF